MSHWRLAVQALHRAGGVGAARDIDNGLFNPSQGLGYAKFLGLVVNNVGRGGSKSNATWCLTQLGRDWAEGRVTEMQGRDPRERVLERNSRDGGKRSRVVPVQTYRRTVRFVSTWLASLPRTNEVRMSRPLPSHVEAVVSV